MKKHSVVDSITNSSSTVYMWPVSDSLGKIRLFLQRVISAVDENAKVDDYFDVHLEINPEYVEIMFDDLREEAEILINKYAPDFFEEETGEPLDMDNFYEYDWELRKELQKIIYEAVNTAYQHGEYELADMGEGYYYAKSFLRPIVEIKGKGDRFDFLAEVMKSFDYDVSYD